MSLSFNDSILAVSTPSGISLRAIIRLSGIEVFHCIRGIFVPDDNEENVCEKGFVSHQGSIYLEREKISIPVCIYFMKSPNSYTREDVVEIHTFGSPPLLEMLMETLLFLKENISGEDGEDAVRRIRIAEPGEFTKRAYLNGRISLTEAESVLHIIRSQTDSELLVAVSNLKGKLPVLMNGIREELLKLCARIEAAIDFSDQDIEIISFDETRKHIERIKEKLRIVTGNEQKARIPRYGVKTVLVGWPNVGKSSLFNKLLNSSRAIVTPVIGTTRDTLEVDLELEGINFRLVDSAGITYENGELESLIVQRTYDSIKDAQIVLFVIDGGMEFCSEQIALFDSITTKNKIVVINKNDLPEKTCYTDFPSAMKDFPFVKTSVFSSDGFEKLRNLMVSCALGNNIDTSASGIVFTMRQKVILCRALEISERILASLNEEIGYELVAIDLRNMVDTVGEVTGEVLTDDILDILFSEFCVGK